MKMTITTIITLIIIGLAAGILSGLVGVGGGIIMVPLFILFLGLSQHNAQGLSLAVMLPPVTFLAVYNYHKAGGGSIVHVGSEAGIVGIKNQLAYNVSKAAVIMMAKSMAIDLAKYNVRVNTVCPGTTETPLVKAAIEKSPDPTETRKALESCRPANRLGLPEEIASAILFMASDEPGYATGSSLVIDGGMTAW